MNKAAQPAGVPREPTAEMLGAADTAAFHTKGYFTRIWQAMYDAAPQSTAREIVVSPEEGMAGVRHAVRELSDSGGVVRFKEGVYEPEARDAVPIDPLLTKESNWTRVAEIEAENMAGDVSGQDIGWLIHVARSAFATVHALANKASKDTVVEATALLAELVERCDDYNCTDELEAGQEGNGPVEQARRWLGNHPEEKQRYRVLSALTGKDGA